jgi:hypothetical protein
MRRIADGEDYPMPATIDDPAVLGQIEEALAGAGYGTVPAIFAWAAGGERLQSLPERQRHIPKVVELACRWLSEHEGGQRRLTPAERAKLWRDDSLWPQVDHDWRGGRQL